MKKLVAKMRKIKMTRWSKLTFGEKVICIIVKLLKLAAIVAIGVAVIGAVVAVIGTVVAIIAGVVIAIGIANAISEGFYNASRAYKPGDRYIWFR